MNTSMSTNNSHIDRWQNKQILNNMILIQPSISPVGMHIVHVCQCMPTSVKIASYTRLVTLGLPRSPYSQASVRRFRSWSDRDFVQTARIRTKRVARSQSAHSKRTYDSNTRRIAYSTVERCWLTPTSNTQSPCGGSCTRTHARTNTGTHARAHFNYISLGVSAYRVYITQSSLVLDRMSLANCYYHKVIKCAYHCVLSD